MPNSTRKYWFERKKYGWGWGFPVSWQGWSVFVAYLLILLLVGTSLLKDVPDDTFTSEVGLFIVAAVVITAVFLVIVHKHAPKPKWQWGKTKQ